MTDPAEDIDRIVDQLRARVAERRARGDYPDDLETKLDAHFSSLVSHRAGAYDFGALRAKLAALAEASTFTANEISYETRLPAGSFVHRVLGRLVRRQTEGVLAQAQRHADAVRQVADEILVALETPAAHTHVDVLRDIEAIYERLTASARAASGPGAMAALEERVRALEVAGANQSEEWFDQQRFADRFRGSSEELARRYDDLAGEFAGLEGPVVDIGCGRGEFLELLLARNIDASGIEVSAAMVDDCVERALPVSFAEGSTWLRTAEDASLGGAALIQVVEHLPAGALVELVRLLADKVRTGGKVVVETINPLSLYTFAHAFTLDPSHRLPVHPAYLVFLFEEAGFTKIDVHWRSPVPSGDRLDEVDANAERVNRLLFADQDYALVAVR